MTALQTLGDPQYFSPGLASFQADMGLARDEWAQAIVDRVNRHLGPEERITRPLPPMWAPGEGPEAGE